MGFRREYSNNNYSLYFEATSSTCNLGMHHAVVTRNPFTCSLCSMVNAVAVLEVKFNFMSLSEWFRWHNCKWCSFKWWYTANIITNNWWFWHQWHNSWSGSFWRGIIALFLCQICMCVTVCIEYIQKFGLYHNESV